MPRYLDGRYGRQRMDTSARGMKSPIAFQAKWIHWTRHHMVAARAWGKAYLGSLHDRKRRRTFACGRVKGIQLRVGFHIAGGRKLRCSVWGYENTKAQRHC